MGRCNSGKIVKQKKKLHKNIPQVHNGIHNECYKVHAPLQDSTQGDDSCMFVGFSPWREDLCYQRDPMTN